MSEKKRENREGNTVTRAAVKVLVEMGIRRSGFVSTASKVRWVYRGRHPGLTGERSPNTSSNLLVALINLKRVGKLSLSSKMLRSKRLPDLRSLLSWFLCAV